jgi:hypothetical protein
MEKVSGSTSFGTASLCSSRWARAITAAPGWETRWAIGSEKRLSAVWRNHDARSGSSTKRLAGANMREVEHGDVASIVDRSGYRCAMFLFPFTAPDVAHEIRTIDGSPSTGPGR